MDKKICLCLLMVFILCLCGCSNQKEINNEYNLYVKKAEKITNSSNDMPFEIKVTIKELTEKMAMYQVIIDQPQYLLNNVKAIIVHNKQTNDIFPSIGIIDQPVNLFSEEKEDFSKGIILTGYLSNDEINNTTFKVLIEYQLNNKMEIKYYVVTSTNIINN